MHRRRPERQDPAVATRGAGRRARGRVLLKPRVTQLASGATVVSEAMAGAETVAFGLYFPTGSRHETSANNGISHFIEHLVFKGTARRDADAINREIDLLGGAANAYTTKESICLYARAVADRLPRVVGLLGDLAAGALPDGVDSEVEREREVILAEIASLDDSPEDLAGDLCDLAFFGEHPLGLPVAGSVRAVARLGIGELRSHYRAHLVARDLVVAAAGRLDHDGLVELVREHIAAVPAGEARPSASRPEPRPATRLAERDLEQVHVCLSAVGIARADPRRAAAELLSTVVGEGYSSRLFREVRDRRGLAYSVYTSLSSYTDGGSFNVYFGVPPAKLAAAFDVVGRVLAGVRDAGVDGDELAWAKQHLRASTLLGLESTGARLGFRAEKALLGEPAQGLDADLARIEAVSAGEVRSLAAELLAEPLAVAAVGPSPPGQVPERGWTLPG